MREEVHTTLFLVTIKAILFCMAVSLFFGVVYFTKQFHNNTRKEVRNNDTIFVNDTPVEAILLDMSDVINEILLTDSNVTIYVNGSQITPYMREQIKENKTAINLHLPSSGTYSKKCIYTKDGKLTKIEFILEGA